jgi:Ohr subfamily peroxiredoxin
MTALYTTAAMSKGGRAGGKVALADGGLWYHTEHSKGLGGSGEGSNPEQLFAAGWSACFEGAMGLAARKMKVTLPPDLAIDAEVDLCLKDGAYFLQARLNISLPGVERSVAQALADAAHQTCPYSKATRGNIEVAINVL